MLSLLDNKNIDYQLITGKYIYSSTNKYVNKGLIFINYFRYFIVSLLALCRTKDNVLYYESISSLPVVVYKKLFPKSKLRIFIHFHEYFSTEEYKRQSYLSRMGRKYEESLFAKAKWISHTNKDRLKMFVNDVSANLDKSVLHELPNYPSKNWNTLKINKVNREQSKKTRFVHIGSISLHSLYLKELLTSYGNDEKFELHFYSHSSDAELINWLKSFDNVFYHGSIAYKNIPKEVYGKYDVGLVLYKGNSLNFTYNAPNKIFEYLALDLDVWCSNKLLTAKNYEIRNTYPKLLMVDFEDFEKLNYKEFRDRKQLKYKKSPYFYEKEYCRFIQKLKAS